MGSNEMYVFGGNRQKSVITQTDYPHKWAIDEAYIMGGSSDKTFDKQDIGIARLHYAEQFFDKIALKDPSKWITEDIVPVCLAALNRDIRMNEKLRGVGWGNAYVESPVEAPIYSSCMTSEASPLLWRFQNCDIENIRKRGWKCEKNKSPPSYEKGDVEKCIDYFDDALLNKDNLNSKQLEAIDVMYINDDTTTKAACYQPALLQNRGWCKLKFQPDKKVVAWGICSSSCDIKEMIASGL